MSVKLCNNFSIIFLLAVILCACSSQPTSLYKPATNAGFGYKEKQLGENYYRVEFKLSGSKKKAQDYALLYASELTAAQGYDWFVVLKRDALEEQEKAPLATSYNSRPVITRSCGLLGCRDNVQTLPNFNLDEGITDTSITAIVEIKFGKGVRPALDNSYDAREINETLSAQYPNAFK